jgi:hypothetical protein
MADYKIESIPDSTNKLINPAFPKHHELIGNGPKRFLFVGESGSGKTEMLRKLIPKLSFSKLVICAKAINQAIYKDIDQCLKKASTSSSNHTPYESKLTSDLDVLDEVYDENRDLAMKKKKVPSTLVIIDDFADKKSLEDPKMTQLFTSGRQYVINVILILQNLFTCPQIIRRNLTNLCLFHCPGAEQHIFTQHLKDKPFKSLRDFMKIYDKVMKEGYSCLHIVLQDPLLPKYLWYRNGFKELIKLDQFSEDWDQFNQMSDDEYTEKEEEEENRNTKKIRTQY